MILPSSFLPQLKEISRSNSLPGWLRSTKPRSCGIDLVEDQAAHRGVDEACGASRRRSLVYTRTLMGEWMPDIAPV